MTVLNTERAWRQIESHDASGDNRFANAVRTTGIYCRPYCPSRRSALKNVVLYQTPEQARAAGQYFATRGTHRFRAELAASATVTSGVYEAGYGSSSRVYEGSGHALG